MLVSYRLRVCVCVISYVFAPRGAAGRGGGGGRHHQCVMAFHLARLPQRARSPEPLSQRRAASPSEGGEQCPVLCLAVWEEEEGRRRSSLYNTETSVWSRPVPPIAVLLKLFRVMHILSTPFTTTHSREGTYLLAWLDVGKVCPQKLCLGVLR